MMFTPLIFIVVTKENGNYMVNPFAIALVALSWALLLKWEIIYHAHPERFSDATNLSIRCANCKEKLCAHKKQLQYLLKKSRELLRQRLNRKDEGEAE